MSKLSFRCNDEKVVEVDKEVAMKSGTLKDVIEDANEDSEFREIPISEISSKTFKKVMEYCEHHINEDCSEIEILEDDEINEWDIEYLKSMKEDNDNTLLLDVGLAVDYLNIPKLFNLICRHIASDIRGNGINVELIRNYFHIPKPPENAQNPAEMAVDNQ